MKRMRAVLLIFVLLFSLVGCSSNQAANDETKAAAEQKTEASKNETEANSSEATTEVTTEAATQTQASDQNLEGIELLKSVFGNLKEVKSLYVKLKMTSLEVSDVEMVLHRDGENARTEMNFDGRHTVNIFNVDDDYIYSYAVGEKNGTKMKHTGSADYADMIPSFSADDLAEEDFEGLVTARRDKLNGQDVVYFEIQEYDEDLGGDVINKIWFSEKHSFFLKMEAINPDGSLEMSMDVLEIEVNKDFSKMMVPPQDVEFVSY